MEGRMQTAYEKAMAQVPPGVIKIISALDNLSILFGKAASWLAIPMILGMIYEVFMRNAFTKPTIWASDLTVMLFGVLFMLASPYCLREGGHVRTDFFYHNWSVRRKALSDIVHYIVLFFPAHLIFLEIAWSYFFKSYMQNEVSPTSSWMMIIWPAKFVIPLYCVLTMAQGISELIKCAYRFRTNMDLWHVAPSEDSMEYSATGCKQEL